MKSVTDKIADRLEAEANERGMSTRHYWLGLDGEEHAPIEPPTGEHCPRCGNQLEAGNEMEAEEIDGEGEARTDFVCRACGCKGVAVRALVFERFEEVSGPLRVHAGKENLVMLPDKE